MAVWIEGGAVHPELSRFLRLQVNGIQLRIRLAVTVVWSVIETYL